MQSKSAKKHPYQYSLGNSALRPATSGGTLFGLEED